MNLNFYLHPEYNPNLGVYQATIPYGYEPGRVKGTGFWGNVYLPNNPDGLKVGTEYTMTTSINGKLVGVPMFNPYNSDPRYLDAINWHMRYQDDQSKGGKNIPYDEQKMKTFEEARKNSYLWGRQRVSQGISPNLVFGVDEVDYSRPQYWGNNEDKSWTYSNGTAKLFNKQGELIPEGEASEIYKKQLEQIRTLKNSNSHTEANNQYSQLRKNILYGSPFAVDNKVFEDEEAQNKEAHNYTPKSQEEANREYGKDWEDSEKETDQLIQEKQQEEKYKNIMNSDSVGLQFKKTNDVD